MSIFFPFDMPRGCRVGRYFLGGCTKPSSSTGKHKISKLHFEISETLYPYLAKLFKSFSPCSNLLPLRFHFNVVFLYHLFFLKVFLLHSNTVIEPASTVDGLYSLVVTTAI